jgi:hypothetical protein
MRALVAALLALAALGGCVVPVGPEWTDPESNYPPTIYSASPPVGSILAPDPVAGTPSVVDVMLADENTDDDLFVRWLIDYPPFDEAVSRLAYQTTQPGGGEVVRPRLSFAPSCGDHQIAPGFGSHRLMMAVSDRPFLGVDPGQPVLDGVLAGNSVARAVWQFELLCP